MQNRALEELCVNIHSDIVKFKPPFRAEHIGSLLRPPALMVERARFAHGEIDQAELKASEDAAIRDAIWLQENLGFKFVTDGEFRRRSYHSFFYRQLGELAIDTIGGTEAKGAQNGGGRGAQPTAIINSRVQWTHPINGADVSFLKVNSDRLPKITIPGPCALHFRGGNAAVLAGAYSDIEEFWSDTVDAFSKELRALADAECRYVQIDETAFAKFGDPDVQAMLASRGDDWSRLIDTYVAVTNRVLRARRPANCTSACICAVAIAEAIGIQKAATRTLPSGYSMHLKSRFISSNTTHRAPAISLRCVSCRAIRWWCLAWFPRKCRRSRTWGHCEGGSTTRQSSWRLIGLPSARNAASLALILVIQ